MDDDVAKTITLMDSQDRTTTFQTSSVVAITTSADRETSTVMLGRGVEITVDGNGEKLRKRVFGRAYSPAKLKVKKVGGPVAKGRDPSAPRRRKVGHNGSANGVLAQQQ